MSTAASQARLLGDFPDGSVSIETSGRLIRPALAVPAAVCDEVRLHVDAEGLHMRAIDPANVLLFDQTIRAAAFEEFDVSDGLTVGVNLGRLQSALSRARIGKRTDDPVSIDLDASRTVVEIEREYGDGSVVRYGDEVLNLEPESVREEPGHMDLDFNSVEAAVNVDGFVDAVNHVDTVADHASLEARDGDVLISGEGDSWVGDDKRVAASFVGAASSDSDDGVRSKYSMDYLTEVGQALKAAKVETVDLEWGDEYPVTCHYERERDGDVVYKGMWLLAPRVRGGDD